LTLLFFEALRCGAEGDHADDKEARYGSDHKRKNGERTREP
jgi:hypothetical protein